MRREIAVIFLSFLFLMIAVPGNSDIIKLKRGISFEGKLIEETEDSYTFELSVGIVTFKKGEVDSVELQSEIENMAIAQEWEEEKIDSDDSVCPDETDKGKAVFEEEKITPDDNAFDIEKVDDNGRYNGMIKYKGRYVTPEVYEIIKKEREIERKRYKFIREKRIKKG